MQIQSSMLPEKILLDLCLFNQSYFVSHLSLAAEVEHSAFHLHPLDLLLCNDWKSSFQSGVGSTESAAEHHLSTNCLILTI